jgi:preprotein translocase subunit SecG
MQVLNIFHVLIAIALIAFVLVQRGQGATAGAAFGSGASGTVFGARGAGNFLSRSTWVLAALFCAISLTMAVMVSRMMQTAEPDLGVVAAGQPAAEVREAPAAEQPVGPGEPAALEAPSDVPADVSNELPGELPAEVPDDVPALNSAAEDEPAAEGDDLPEPPAEDGD